MSRTAKDRPAAAVNRRLFLAYAGGTTLALFATDAFGKTKRVAEALPGGGLNPRDIPKFAAPLAVPPPMPSSGPNAYTIAAREFAQQILPPPLPPTPVWGYGAPGDAASFHSPAFTIEAKRGVPIAVTWINDLKRPDGTFRPHLFAVDPTLHWANPAGPRDARPRYPAGAPTPAAYRGPVPIVTHVHGMADVDDWSDGYPEAWRLPDASDIPSGYATTGTWHDFFKDKAGGRGWSAGQSTFRYPNAQRPSTLWFHDHALGITRLNVYAGLAGFYLIRSDDPADAPTVARSGAPAVLPDGAFELPLAIQDRSFNADGSLFYPDSRAFFDRYGGPFIPASQVPPIWVPEFFGNVMMVNGRAWPSCAVEPRRHRLRILNGCNARFLVLAFGDPKVAMWQIGTEGGFLRAPVRRTQLLLAPAERADVIVDFGRLRPGETATLRNLGPDGPFQGGDDAVAADPRTTGLVMQFRVDRGLSGPDPTTPPGELVMPAIAPLEGGIERPLALLETMVMARDEKDIPVEANLGVIDRGAGIPKGIKALPWHAPVSENPSAGAVETWAFYNFTGDAHPMHLHETFFQVVDRQRFNPKTGALVGKRRPPPPEEAGWKDTVIAYPGEVTRVRMRFGKDGQFVWHCHIVEHEDNEMMRPFRIGPPQPGQPDAPGGGHHE